MFERFKFSPKQINNYFHSAAGDFKIASDADIKEAEEYKNWLKTIFIKAEIYLF